MTWKKKVSKSNVLLFQLQASVRGIKGKESGFLPTPTTMDHIDRKGMRPSRAATNRKSGYLSEMIKMYPTPTQDSASERTKKYKQGGMPLTVFVNQGNKLGGKLNPHFVEFLMGYPMNWTKIEPTE